MIGVATDGRENSRRAGGIPMSVSTTPTAGSTLLPPLANPNDQEAIRFGPRALTYRELTGVATYLAGLLQSKPRVAIWAVPAGLDLDPASGRARLSYRRAAELFRVRTGWTLHQLRHSALTHAAEDGTNLPLLLARSRHASVRSLERYARPGPEAVAPATSPRPTRHVAARDPPAPQLEAGRRSRRGGPHSPVEYKEVGLDPDPLAGHAIRSTSRGSLLQSVGSLGTLPAWTCEP
jgi:hypothetical protein